MLVYVLLLVDFVINNAICVRMCHQCVRTCVSMAFWYLEGDSDHGYQFMIVLWVDQTEKQKAV